MAWIKTQQEKRREQERETPHEYLDREVLNGLPLARQEWGY
jgi:hypothetical protein